MGHLIVDNNSDLNYNEYSKQKRDWKKKGNHVVDYK